MSARNRELLALVPASLLLTAGFAAIFIQQSAQLSDVSLTYGAAFLALCLCGHLVIRATLPHADPYLFPLVAVLACFGLVVIYRIDETLAREQAQWFVVGLILFAATLVFLRDFRVLERYRYTIALAGLVLLLLPRVPGIGQQVNGAYLGVGIGPVSFQPAESETAATPEEPPPRTAPLPGDAEPSGRRTRRRRVPVGVLVALVLAAIVLVGAWMATRAVYFVGTDPRDDRTITIFRGLPYELPLGIELYERYAGSGVTIDDVPAARRSTFTQHKLRSRDDAENLVIALERGQIE